MGHILSNPWYFPKHVCPALPFLPLYYTKDPSPVLAQIRFFPFSPHVVFCFPPLPSFPPQHILSYIPFYNAILIPTPQSHFKLWVSSPVWSAYVQERDSVGVCLCTCLSGRYPMHWDKTAIFSQSHLFIGGGGQHDLIWFAE